MGEQDSRIECRVCGERVHSIEMHLKEKHVNRTKQDYLAEFPGAPLLSQKAEEAIAARLAQKKAVAADPSGVQVAMAGAAASMAVVAGTDVTTKKAFHEIFSFDAKTPGAMSASGKPIPITVLNVVGADRALIPTFQPEHVFEVENTKHICLALDLGIPVYIWGHSGVSKTTTLLNLAALTGRPTIRVQHTLNTEEAHIIGQYVVKGGETVYQLGPLAMAMLHGWFYIADEYDFALPSVLSVYQPILEGNALFIKDAPPEYRIIKPHPNFRFAATGNTNGIGDESGLYQGTNPQNFANYERFGVVLHFTYMQPQKEVEIILNQAKPILRKDAERLVEFANKVRMEYDANKLSGTISPRALIYAARLGLRLGSFNKGLTMAFVNRLGKVDREAVKQVMDRIFHER